MSLPARTFALALLCAALVLPATLHAAPAPRPTAPATAAVAAHSPTLWSLEGLLHFAHQVWNGLQSTAGPATGRITPSDAGPALDPNGG